MVLEKALTEESIQEEFKVGLFAALNCTATTNANDVKMLDETRFSRFFFVSLRDEIETSASLTSLKFFFLSDEFVIAARDEP